MISFWPLVLTVYTPLAGVFLLPMIRHTDLAGWMNSALAGVSFCASLWLAWNFAHAQVPSFSTAGLRIDALNLPLLVLNTLVGFSTAIFSRGYMQHMLHTRLAGARGVHGMRMYHALFQAFLFTMLLALSTANLGILWVAVEGCTLSTVLLVSLYRTPEALAAAWKYFILCSVGIALALFGTILVYYAALHALPDTAQGLNWKNLYNHRQALQPTVMSLAFVFVLVGYGTKVGLVPMHEWLPDAHSEGPTPISALLSGLLLNVALYAVLRIKMLVDGALMGTTGANMPGYLLIGFGLGSLIVAAFSLQRQSDIKRLFSYSSIEHMGLITFGFGLGGSMATIAALAYMIAHSLTKSAIFHIVGHVTRMAGTQSIAHIRGLIRTQPRIGWTFALLAAALAGFPPFGIFTSEIMLLIASLKGQSGFLIILIPALVLAFSGLLRHMQPMLYGSAPEITAPINVNLWPVFIQLFLLVWLGLAMPEVLVHWLSKAGALITGAGTA